MFNLRPPATSGGAMGHVRDTLHTQALEGVYGYKIIGYSARWKVVNGQYRVEVLDNVWRGVYPMSREDLEFYA